MVLALRLFVERMLARSVKQVKYKVALWYPKSLLCVSMLLPGCSCWNTVTTSVLALQSADRLTRIAKILPRYVLAHGMYYWSR